MTIFWLIIALMTCVAIGVLVVPLLSSKKTILTILALILILPVLSISLYFKIGASQKIAEQKDAKKINIEVQKLGSLQNIILSLRQKVESNPDSEGWSLLGRLYLKTQAFNEAVNAFAKANQLAPHQADIMIGYAQSLYFLHQAVLTPQAKQLLEQALRLQPKQLDALNLLAMDAYQQGNYDAAIAWWEQVLPQLEEGTEVQQKLLQMIAKAQKKAKQK